MLHMWDERLRTNVMPRGRLLGWMYLRCLECVVNSRMGLLYQSFISISENVENHPIPTIEQGFFEIPKSISYGTPNFSETLPVSVPPGLSMKPAVVGILLVSYNRERKFDIEDGSLEGMYKNWQKKLHPDLVHTKSKEEREYAAEQSARVIDAYTTLRKPLSRAIYLMSLEGVEVDEEQTVSEPELLGEIMEIREAVEEAADSQALNKIQSQMEEKLKHWSNFFANAFGRKFFDEALKSIQRMTYYHRVNEEIVKKL
ncbi:hypothetical protein R6Q57_016962 [Mikania cordata]